MTDAPILLEVAPPYATVTLNRPDKMNAFTMDMLDALGAAFDRLDAMEDVSVVILKGAGRAFSTGMDIQAGYSPEKVGVTADRDRLHRILNIFLRIWESPKIVIAQVHGYCCAAASMLAMSADLIYITDDCKVRFPSLPLGGGFVSAFWTWFVGPRKAKEMDLIAGYEISGAELAELNWANRVVAPDALEDLVRTQARRIAATPPDLLRLKKMATNRIMERQGFREAMLGGAEWDTLCHFSEGAKGIRREINDRGLKGALDWFRSQ